MKYLVIKDCPGFKSGDVVESFNDSLKRELICRAPEFPVYLPDKTTEYFQPMWFNFGDKIIPRDVAAYSGFGKNIFYFIPTSYVGGKFFGDLHYQTYKATNDTNEYTRYDSFEDCLKQSRWEFYKETEEKIVDELTVQAQEDGFYDDPKEKNENDFRYFFEVCARNEPTLLLNLLGSSWMEDIYKSFKARLIEELSVSGVIWDGSKIFDGKLCENNKAAD